MRYAMLAACCGLALASYLPSDWLLQKVLLAGVLLLTLLLVALSVACAQRRVILACLAAFLLGVAHSMWYARGIVAHSLDPSVEGELVELQGWVTGLPRQEWRYGQPVQRFDLAVSTSRWVESPRGLRIVRLSWFGGAPVKAGEYWTVRGRLKRPHGFANPGGFDYQLYLHRHSIDATGRVVWAKKALAMSRQRSPLVLTSMAREFMAGRLAAVTDDHRQAHLMRALAVGDGKALSTDDWELLRTTGTTHLFVISGLHIGMVAGAAYLVMRCLAGLLLALWPGLLIHRFAAAAALLTASLYAALAGFSLPTQRALVMLCLLMLGRSGFARVPASFSLLAAALVVLAMDPLALRGSGFWLSFVAVAALLAVFSGRMSTDFSAVCGLLRAQWVSFIALTPLLLFWFQSASLLMPLANLVAVPLLSLLVVPLLLLIMLLSVLPFGLPAHLVNALDWLLTRLWSFLELLARSGDGAWGIELAPGVLGLSLGLLTSLILLSAPGIRLIARPLLFVCSLILSCALLRPGTQPEATLSECAPANFAVLDVGQGLAVVFRAYGKTLVYDTGARFSPEFDAGTAVLLPYLRQARVSELNYLVISHSDNDHYGGASALLEAFSVRNLLASFAMPGYPNKPCLPGSRWHWGAIEFRVLGPLNSALEHANDNNLSCVMHITAPGFSILLPGDIEKATEQQLVSVWGDELRADVLVMPHHGSKTSSGEKLISAVQPRYAIASAGYRNRFGHPHPMVTARYRQAGVRVLSTADSGALEFEFNTCAGKGQAINQHREAMGNYWLSW